MWQALHDAWWRLATDDHPGSISSAPARGVLRAGALLYGGAVALRNLGFDLGWVPSGGLPCRVLSVGSLVVGGAGKTACVELLARELIRRRAGVAVLSRGYGGPKTEYWLRTEGGALILHGLDAADGRAPADEPQVLAARLPGVGVFVGKDRSRSGALAHRTLGVKVVILDDGFQHRQLRRDCDVVLIQARMPFGGWALLPRGPMREPLSALRRAHVLIITKADEALGIVGALGERLRAVNPRAAIVSAAHQPTDLLEAATGASLELSRLGGGPVGLLSSVGDPAGFEATVRSAQGTVAWHQAYPDHHAYTAADWERVCRRAGSARPHALVTTEKDWVRLKAVARPASLPVPLWVLRIEMKILGGGEALHARLDRLLAG